MSQKMIRNALAGFALSIAVLVALLIAGNLRDRDTENIPKPAYSEGSEQKVMPSNRADSLIEGGPVEISKTGNKAPESNVDPNVPVVLRAYGNQLDGRGHEIELDDMSHLNTHDAIALYIPQEDSLVEGTITDVDLTQSGNRILVGKLSEGGSEHRFVFTIGKEQTFGSFNTTKGQYQLETRSGIGRIVSGKTIREGLDFSIPDYVIPQRELPEEAPADDN